MMKWFSFKVKYHGYEIIFMRVLFAALVYKTFNSFLTFSIQEFPVGLAQFFDLTFLANDKIFIFLNILFKCSIVAYVFGVGLILSTGIMLLYSVILATLFYSQGSIGHGYNIISLVLLAQFAAYIYSFVKKGKVSEKYSELNSHDLAIYFTQQTIAAVYMIAGITKLIRNDFMFGIIPGWIYELKYVSVQIVKSHDQAFYSYLNPEMYEKGNIIARFLIEHEFMTRIIFSGGLFLELSAFIILFNRTCSAVLGFLLIMMHIGIMLIMNLYFSENMYVLAIFTIHMPWLLKQGKVKTALYRERIKAKF